jgi:3'-phosphoadenosine 5'-phosphosulfate sulfotransferase (PAPS reductase)/FAD synthetase
MSLRLINSPLPSINLDLRNLEKPLEKLGIIDRIVSTSFLITRNFSQSTLYRGILQSFQGAIVSQALLHLAHQVFSYTFPMNNIFRIINISK